VDSFSVPGLVPSPAWGFFYGEVSFCSGPPCPFSPSLLKVSLWIFYTAVMYHDLFSDFPLDGLLQVLLVFLLPFSTLSKVTSFFDVSLVRCFPLNGPVTCRGWGGGGGCWGFWCLGVDWNPLFWLAGSALHRSSQFDSELLP